MPRQVGVNKTQERNARIFGGPFGSIYRFYIAHEPVSRVVAWLIWGGDIRPFYASMQAIAQVPSGGTVVDAPCGAGVAFRAISPDQEMNYQALDLSSAMLDRARDVALKRRLGQITLVEGNVEALPFDDQSADLFLSYWGLHCVADPEQAIAEAHRCLRPGGRLVGGAIVSGHSLRQRLFVRPHHSAFGKVGSAKELRRWIEARFGQARVEVSGALAYFEARRPDSA